MLKFKESKINKSKDNKLIEKELIFKEFILIFNFIRIKYIILAKNFLTKVNIIIYKKIERF